MFRLPIVHVVNNVLFILIKLFIIFLIHNLWYVNTQLKFIVFDNWGEFKREFKHMCYRDYQLQVTIIHTQANAIIERVKKSMISSDRSIRKIIMSMATKLLEAPITKHVNNASFNILYNCDWKEYPETSIRIITFIIYMMNVPVCWISKVQRGVILSSSEAE
jgi:hypothetical protein